MLEVKIVNLSKNFGSRRVLRNVSITIRDSECVGLVGPNGSGKTTLLRSMLGLYDFEGNVEYGGRNLDSISITDEKIFFMSDSHGLFKDLNVWDNLEFFYRCYNRKAKKAEMNRDIDRILANIGLENRSNDKVKNLSKGMKQRLSCGRTMVAEPSLMLLDEPFTNLDYEGRLFLENHLISLKEKGASLLVSSHDLSHLQKICDSIVFIKEGSVVEKTDVKECGDIGSKYASLMLDR